MKLLPSTAFVLLFLFVTKGPSQEARLISSVEPDLEVPTLVEQEPAPGIRAKQVHPDFQGTGVYHTLYLPEEWNSSKKWPVVIELPGNGNFRNRLGDTSSGIPDQCLLGFGLSRGKKCILVALPFLSGDGKDIAITWWGDRPGYDPVPTVNYIKLMVKWVCETYHGDPEKVVLAGFSRGAIACNYIGLHDDEISQLWRGMFVYSHYDGVRRWPYPKSDAASALERLKRLKGIPQFICHEGSGIGATKSYLEKTGVTGDFTYTPTGFVNHNGAWLLRPSPARTEAWKWFDQLIR